MPQAAKRNQDRASRRRRPTLAMVLIWALTFALCYAIAWGAAAVSMTNAHDHFEDALNITVGTFQNAKSAYSDVQQCNAAKTDLHDQGTEFIEYELPRGNRHLSPFLWAVIGDTETLNGEISQLDQQRDEYSAYRTAALQTLKTHGCHVTSTTTSDVGGWI